MLRQLRVGSMPWWPWTIWTQASEVPTSTIYCGHGFDMRLSHRLVRVSPTNWPGGILEYLGWSTDFNMKVGLTVCRCLATHGFSVLGPWSYFG